MDGKKEVGSWLGDVVKEFVIFARKRERARMYELSTKYKHIKDLILVLKENPVFEQKIIPSEHVPEMFMLEGDIYLNPNEFKAMKDWLKVFNGINPNWGDSNV
jgi:hypothetical protein